MGDAGRAGALGFHGGGEAAHELVVIVGIENVVFAVVLRLRHQIDAGEPLAQIATRRGALEPPAIGVTAPCKIDVGDIASAVPAALVEHRSPAP